MAALRYSSPRATTSNSFLQDIRQHAPNSIQLIGFATLIISGGILLLLTGLTLTATILGLIFFGPLILISSPIWVPVGFFIFVTVAGTLSFLGFGVATVTALSWLYRYFRGFHPPGSDRFDYATTRIGEGLC
ncbi:hypothetical protein ACJIZ3_024154 [Penstemon smallii]|uniref:Oleosin n=1 Tax=Penstemon smallii TaxID=265156 RepID=A0ABD3TTJ1_9LAMI